MWAEEEKRRREERRWWYIYESLGRGGRGPLGSACSVVLM
jgi:hypothetical protein